MFPISDSIKSGKFPLFNILLIICNFLVFFYEIATPNPDAFIAKYALIPSHVNFGDPRTLLPFITAIFLHGGWLHILSNMWFLWVFGDDVEGALGRARYLLLYFAAGIAGNIAQFLLMPHADVPMLGASGAIAGILGAYFIMFPYSKVKTLIFIFFFITITEISAPFMLGYWFVLQLISAAGSLQVTQSGGIAFWAHIAGFITGILAARITGGRRTQTGLIWES